MPTWGLTKQQRELEPWDLDPALLAPCKVVTDEVWGDIHTNVLEQALIDTAPMQRLRRVRQLGTSHEVYPGATHTRFSHSLGALKVVQDLLDATLNQREGLHPVPDLLEQWAEGEVREKKIAEAVVLGRLGALTHDLCHVPFGHSIEDDLKVLISHDSNGPRFKQLWRQIRAELPAQLRRHLRKSDLSGQEVATAVRTANQLFLGSAPLRRNLRPLIISKDDEAQQLREDPDANQYPFVEDLVGDTICADLLDYLLRDHLNTGLPASLGQRFVSAFFAVPDGRGVYSTRAALNIVRNGRERTDVVSELLKALRYRYELNERVLFHHAKLAADAMIGKALDLWADAVWIDTARDHIAELHQAENLLEGSDVRGLKTALHESLPPRAIAGIERAVGNHLEERFLEHGDDGLLEHITALPSQSLPETTAGGLIGSLRAQAADLAARLVRRDLFEVAGRVGLQGAPAATIYRKFGAAPDRIALQDEAQRFAELGRTPQVLLWLPDPKMRLKLARVLVDDGTHVNQFNHYEDARGRRGGDIYRADGHLWAMWVFTDRSLTDVDRHAVLVYLADRLGVAWEGMVDHYGPRCWTWMARWGLSTLLSTNAEVVGPRDHRVEQVIEEHPEAISRREGAPTRTTYLQQLSALDGVPAPRARRTSARGVTR